MSDHPAPPASTEPDWVAHAVWWQVFPLGFTGAERESAPLTHRLPHVESWLDYLIDLGCNGLALGPVFTSSTHGYDTVDHLTVDPRLGDDADFDHLVAAAREKGVRILLDGVFNHVGRDHSWVVDALRDGPDSSAGQRIRWSGDHPESFEGHDILVALNHRNAEVRDHVVEIMTHWLARGADGWRLDAAYAVDPSFWAAVLPRVRAEHPNAWFVGEMIHGDYAAYVGKSGVDSVTQYELWKATWSAVRDGNFFELAHALGRHDALLPQFVPATFVGNHDVTRLATTLGDDRDVDIATALLFFVPGTPTVYYGDEQGFRGVKEDRVGGDDEIRPEFPATPADLSPLGLPRYRVHQATISLRRRFPWLRTATVDVETLTNTALTLRAAHDGTTLRLALNLGEDAVARPGGEVLAAADGVADTLPPHTWAVVQN